MRRRSPSRLTFQGIPCRLSHNREQVLSRLSISSGHIQHYLRPFSSNEVARAVELFTHQDRNLYYALENALCMAQWLESQAGDLRLRAAKRHSPSGNRRSVERGSAEAGYSEFFSGVFAGEEIDPVPERIEHNLAGVQAHADAVDEEAALVADMLAESEAALLAVIAKRNEQDLIDVLVEITRLLGVHAEAARKLCLQPASADPAAGEEEAPQPHGVA